MTTFRLLNNPDLVGIEFTREPKKLLHKSTTPSVVYNTRKPTRLPPLRGLIIPNTCFSLPCDDRSKSPFFSLGSELSQSPLGLPCFRLHRDRDGHRIAGAAESHRKQEHLRHWRQELIPAIRCPDLVNVEWLQILQNISDLLRLQRLRLHLRV